MEYLKFVLMVDKNNTCCVPISESKAGYLLRVNKAKIINHEPLVIMRLDNYDSELENRDIFELKIDSGYLNIGFSVSDNDHEYIAGQVEMLNGMSQRLTDRKSKRTTRRQRIRYRKNKNIDYKTVHNPTYKNGNEDGWFAPSMVHKIDTHIRLVDKLSKWVPVDKIIVEVANFNIQAMEAYLKEEKILKGKDYQNGQMKGYENIVSYVRDRDEHLCYFCNKQDELKAKKLRDNGQRLEVHHIIPRKNGGSNRPDNLICLCQKHHQMVHSNNNNNKYFEELQSVKLSSSYKDATFMNIVRHELIRRLKEKYPDINIQEEYGYNTKINRKMAELKKFHYNDAVCIKEFKNTTLTKNIFIIDQKRCNNRTMENFFDAKYIDSRDGKVKTGDDLKKIRYGTKSKRSTNKEHIENLREFRKEKVKKGDFYFICHSYCLKAGDLIYIKQGKHKGKTAEVTSIKASRKKCIEPIIEINNKVMDINREIKKRKFEPNMTEYEKSLLRYRLLFTYKGCTAKEPQIELSKEEYDALTRNKSDKVAIVRTRRGMIWREYDRLTYEAENMDQEEKKLEVKNKKQELKAA